MWPPVANAMADQPAPTFSVITPVRNGAAHVASYVRGLQAQTHGHWEAIVVDDGSTDATLARLHHHCGHDPRFRVVRNERPRHVPGPYQARNLALELARGTWLCFLDIDDLWLPHKLQHQAAHLQANPQLRLLYSTQLRARRGSARGRLRQHPPLLGPQTWLRVANPVPMLTACVHRDSVGNLRFAARHHEDYLFWHAVCRRLQPQQIQAERQPLAIYCIDPGSLSANKVQAAHWIWACYRHLGYPPLLAAAALSARAVLQLWIMAQMRWTAPWQISWTAPAAAQPQP
jgi:teichuronic acid biosynthesis glycosyltransferase TuaG